MGFSMTLLGWVSETVEDEDCAFQSHAFSKYSSGKQDSINIQFEYSYLKLYKDVIFIVSFSLSFSLWA